MMQRAWADATDDMTSGCLAPLEPLEHEHRHVPILPRCSYPFLGRHHVLWLLLDPGTVQPCPESVEPERHHHLGSHRDALRPGSPGPTRLRWCQLCGKLGGPVTSCCRLPRDPGLDIGEDAQICEARSQNLVV